MFNFLGSSGNNRNNTAKKNNKEELWKNVFKDNTCDIKKDNKDIININSNSNNINKNNCNSDNNNNSNNNNKSNKSNSKNSNNSINMYDDFENFSNKSRSNEYKISNENNSSSNNNNNNGSNSNNQSNKSNQNNNNNGNKDKDISNNSEDIKSILFQNTIKKENEEKERNRLIYELGDNLTQAQILYSDINELNRIKDELMKKNKNKNQNKDKYKDKDKDKYKDKYKDKNQNQNQSRDKNEYKSQIEDEKIADLNDDYNDVKKEKEKHNEDNKTNNLEANYKYYDNEYDNLFTLKSRISKDVISNKKDKTEKYDDKSKFEKDVKWMEGAIKLNKYIPLVGKIAVSLGGGADAAGMLNIASGKFLPLYTKDAVKLENVYDKKLTEYDSGKLSKWLPYIEEKIKTQFKDFKYDLNDIKGNIFKENSAPVKRIKDSQYFRELLINNKEDILKGKRTSFRFKSGNEKKDKNLHNAFGSVDILSSGIDKDGNLRLYMFDTYDFNKNETNPNVEAGRRQMLKGNLKGFFTLHEILLTKNELSEIWK